MSKSRMEGTDSLCTFLFFFNFFVKEVRKLAAVVPPSLQQVIQMRETIKNAANFRILMDWGDTILDSSRNFFIWDDNHQLLYAISENCEMGTSAGLPFKIMAFPYDQIEGIYANTD